jgi:hypothetical protein
LQKGVKLRPSGVLPDRSPVFGGLTPATAVWAPPRCTQNFGGPTHLGPPVSNSPHFVRPRINKQMMWRVIDCNQLCNQFPIRRNPVRTGVSTLKKSSTEMGAGVRGLTFYLAAFDLWRRRRRGRRRRTLFGSLFATPIPPAHFGAAALADVDHEGESVDRRRPARHRRPCARRNAFSYVIRARRYQLCVRRER